MMMMRGDDGISGININKLPPGFFFCPSDEELILHFLYPKATSSILLPNNIIPDLDLSLTDPWQLNGKALSSGNNEYYFYTKVKNSENEKRRTENGYWKEMGVAEPIVSGVESNKKVGMKKYLVFHIIVGDETNSTGTHHETNWVMHEYHLHHICSSSAADSASSPHQISWSSGSSSRGWVLCRVYEKNGSSRCHHQQAQAGVTSSCSTLFSSDDDDTGTELSWLDEVYLSLDDHLHQEQEDEITSMHYV